MLVDADVVRADAPWSSPAFWSVLPVILALAVVGVAAVIALFRARREDVPGIFTTFMSAFSRVTAHPLSSRPSGDDDRVAHGERDTTSVMEGSR